MESLVEGQGASALLQDEADRTRITDLCAQIRKRCARLSSSEMRQDIKRLLQQAATGQHARLQQAQEASSEVPATATVVGVMPLMEAPRGKQPLSLFD